VTIFPEMVSGAAQWGVLARAQQSGHVALRAVDLREFAEDRHRTVDDYPYGGEPGMLLRPEPLGRAVRGLRERGGSARVLLMSPQGARLDQRLCERLSLEERLIVVCGRYKGVDERCREAVVDEEVSIGDYVLSGGELAALVLLEAVVRLLPGVLSDSESALRDSFADGLLDAPHYTRPAEWDGRRVPEVLLSGDMGRIARWRQRERLRRTLIRRPDLLERAVLSEEDDAVLEELRREHAV
jgi:tRNA (guanine37-N1)-methyltransferase